MADGALLVEEMLGTAFGIVFIFILLFGLYRYCIQRLEKDMEMNPVLLPDVCSALRVALAPAAVVEGAARATRQGFGRDRDVRTCLRTQSLRSLFWRRLMSRFSSLL